MLQLLNSLRERQSKIETDMATYLRDRDLPGYFPEVAVASVEEAPLPEVHLKGLTALSGAELSIEVIDGEIVTDLRKRVAHALGCPIHRVHLLNGANEIVDDMRVVLGGDAMATVVNKTADAKFEMVSTMLTELDECLSKIGDHKGEAGGEEEKEGIEGV